jgi:hypothetical protein
LLLIEGTLGIIQAIYGFFRTGTFSSANGDHVEGTIHIGLAPEGAFANPMFAVNMTFLCLLALVAVIKFRYRYYPLIIGLLSLVLASVVHVILFLITAVLIVMFINFANFFKNPKIFITFLFSIVLILIPAFYFIGSNIEQLPDQVNRDLKDNPKALIRYETFFVIPKEYPAMPLIGLGPGQFSSRASLIGSGRYFGSFYTPKAVPLLTPKTSAPMEKFVIPIWAWSARVWYYGSTQQPFYSWLSVYSEFGFVGSSIVISIVTFLLIKAKFLRTNRQNILYRILFQVGVLFLFFLGAQENYWEVAQAIFIGLILLKLLYANMLYSGKQVI